MCSNPQIAIGSELFDHTAYLAIICHFHIEKILTRVELSAFLLKRKQTLVYLYATLTNVFMLVNILIRVEVHDSSFKIVNRLFKLLLA